MRASGKTNETSAPGNSRPALLLLLLVAFLPTSARGKTVVTWDFTTGTHAWQGNQQVQGLAVTAEGLAFASTGNDPWIEGPAVDLPGAGMTRVQVRMKSDADGGGELFYGRSFRAGHSVRFTVKNDNQWHEYSLTIAQPLGRATRFRLDPATGASHIVVSSIAVEAIASLRPPAFERPLRPGGAADEPLSVSSGELMLEHYRSGWGGFVLNPTSRIRMGFGFFWATIRPAGVGREGGRPESRCSEDPTSWRGFGVAHNGVPVCTYGRSSARRTARNTPTGASWRPAAWPTAV